MIGYFPINPGMQVPRNNLTDLNAQREVDRVAPRATAR